MNRRTYKTKIRLPVERGNFESYRLNTHVTQTLLHQISDSCNILSVNWEDGYCVADVEFSTEDQLEKIQSLELKLNGVKLPEYRKN